MVSMVTARHAKLLVAYLVLMSGDCIASNVRMQERVVISEL